MNRDHVTLRDVYEIAERLEKKFDVQFDDHETRLRIMEKFQNKAMGVVSLLAVFSGLLANWFWEKIVGKS